MSVLVKMVLGLNIFILMSVSSQTTDIKEFDDFNGLEIIGRMDVKIIVSDKNMIELYFEGIEREKINIENIDGNLKVKIVSTLSYKNIRIQVKVFANNLKSIQAFSGASIISDETLVEDSLNLACSGGGEIILKLATDYISSTASTGGIITLSGSSKMHLSKVSSGATISAPQLICENYDIVATAKGIGKINCTKFMECKAVSGGSIIYSGSPVKKKVSERLGGKVQMADALY